jgi:putative phage-type endonuclease
MSEDCQVEQKMVKRTRSEQKTLEQKMDFESVFRVPKEEMDKKIQAYVEEMKVTAEDVVRVMNTPQRTPEWIKYRSNRMTASNYGSAAGHNPHSKPRQLLMSLLWDTFKGNAATEYGTKNEPVAAKVFETFALSHAKKQNADDDMSFYYPGLIICQKEPWLAVSPDGLPCIKNKKTGKNIRYLLEIKCPFTKKLYPHIPHYYFDQIQGIMGILQLPYCDFVVWTPEKTQIRRYNFDSEYWTKVLYPRLHQFYFEEYLPRLILKKEGKLKQGELEPSLHIEKVDRPKLKFDFIWEPTTTRKRKAEDDALDRKNV